MVFIFLSLRSARHATGPPKAHQALDRAVDAAYLANGGRRSFTNDAERVAFLFELYQRYTSLLPAEGTKAKFSGRRQRAKQGA